MNSHYAYRQMLSRKRLPQRFSPAAIKRQSQLAVKLAKATIRQIRETDFP